MPIPYEESYHEFLKAMTKLPGIKESCEYCLSFEAFTWGYIMAISRGFG